MALAVVGAATQSMLPESVTLSGAVTDTTGKPLSDVWIYHSGVAVETIKTNAQGHFEIKTRAPAIVFRKDGFQSQYLRVAENRHLSIVLTGSPPLRECGTWGRCLTLKGFRSSLCLPRVHGVNAGKQGNDVDYGQRWFWFETKNGKVGIQHAAGPMWGGGFPSDQQVWWSSDYRETSYRDQQGFAIADARGKSPDGKLWRTLGHWGEAASYRGVSPEDAPRLDRVLDGVCLAGTGSGHTKENN
jgi:hypothetical protein